MATQLTMAILPTRGDLEGGDLLVGDAVEIFEHAADRVAVRRDEHRLACMVRGRGRVRGSRLACMVRGRGRVRGSTVLPAWLGAGAGLGAAPSCLHG